MMLSTDIGSAARVSRQVHGRDTRALLVRPAGVGLPVLLLQFGGRGGEVVRAMGLAGGPVEEYFGGDGFEAGVLGPEPVRGGVAFDVGAVAEQFRVVVAGAGDGEDDVGPGSGVPSFTAQFGSTDQAVPSRVSIQSYPSPARSSAGRAGAVTLSAVSVVTVRVNVSVLIR